MGYARKVLKTGECELLILDEVLGLVDNGIITVEELEDVLSTKGENTDVIMTGNKVSEKLYELADEVTLISTDIQDNNRRK